MALDSIVVWIIVGGIAGLLAEWLIGGVNAGCIGTVHRYPGGLHRRLAVPLFAHCYR